MRAVVVTVGAAEAELAADALWSHGVVAIEERLLDGTTVELWTSLGAAGLPDGFAWPWRIELVDDAVVDGWRPFAVPVDVTPTLVVRPAWVPVASAGDRIVVAIEPGSTFGLGDHPTTRLCLAALESLVRPGATVLDVGCGSGVLAVAAMMLGAASARGVDISPESVPVATANAALNGVEIDVSTTPLAEVDGCYDLVVANILAPVLVELSEDLRRVLAPGGRLVVSGLLAEPDRHAHVVDALAPLVVERVTTLDGWCSLELSS